MIRFIAEIGSNHNQNLERAIELIKTAKSIGCWGVKFQLFRAEELYAPQYKQQIEMNKAREFPISWIPKIAKVCEETKIKFGCSVFHEQDVDEISSFVDWFKLSSFDIRRDSLTCAMMQTGIPLMVSLGLARGRDIIRIGQLAEECNFGRELTLLHCVSKYPALLQDCNMEEGIGRIMRLIGSKQFNYDSMKFGWSDHTTHYAAILSAITMGGTTIECHLDLEDKKGAEFNHRHCWTPHLLDAVISDIKLITIANGKGQNWWEDVSDSTFDWMADPEDGMRPLRKVRNSGSI